MKKFSIIIIAVLLVSLNSCYKTMDQIQSPPNEVILSYPAVNQYNIAASGLIYWGKALINPDLGKTSDTLVFSLNIPKPTSSEITVNIGVDAEAVAAFNKDTTITSTKYALMPAEYYTIVTPVISIKPGTTDTTFKVALKPSLFDISQTGYILPISIITANGISISSMRTAYVHIEKDPNPPLSRAGWTVTGFSSEEAVGEGAGNGQVKNLLDNNTNTFWHSQWQGGTPGPPHWFVINMNTSSVLKGIMFLDRQGVGSDGRPKDVKVEVSKDNTSWSVAASLTLADNNKWQKITFSKPTEAVQYFKVTITSMYGAASVKYTNMAELKVF